MLSIVAVLYFPSQLLYFTMTKETFCFIILELYTSYPSLYHPGLGPVYKEYNRKKRDVNRKNNWKLS